MGSRAIGNRVFFRPGRDTRTRALANQGHYDGSPRPPLVTRWNRRSENSHELTAWERSKAGYVTAVRTWKRKYAEALALVDERV